MLNRELEKEYRVLRLREDKKQKNQLEKVIVQVMRQNLRKVKRQTGDKVESKIPYIIEHMTYDRHSKNFTIYQHFFTSSEGTTVLHPEVNGCLQIKMPSSSSKRNHAPFPFSSLFPSSECKPMVCEWQNQSLNSAIFIFLWQIRF